MVLTLLAIARTPPVWALDAESDAIEFHISTNLPVICVREGKLDCIAGRLVDRACALEGLRYRFTDRPWKRAEEEIVESNGSAFFLVTGKDEGNSKLDWFFEVYSDEVWIYSFRPLDAESPGRSGLVGVRRGSPFDQIPSQYGSFSVYALNNWPSGAMMLKRHRLDAVLATRLVIEANMVQSPILADLRGYHKAIGRMGWYIVRDSRAAPSEAAQRFKRGLEAARAEPWFAEMLASYGVSR